MSLPSIVVQRRDTRVLVGRVQLQTSAPRGLEPVRAARFAAWHLGVTCWAWDDTGDRVLHVARPHVALDPILWKDRAACPYPGCCGITWREGSYNLTSSGGGRVEVPRLVWLERHQAQQHYLCSCGRFFTEEGWSKHRGQVRRRDRPGTHLRGEPVQLKLRPGVGRLHGTARR